MADSTGPRHLLVVDDEPHIGLLLRPHLEELGYRVSLARTLGGARAALREAQGTVDGLLLDLHLPDGSGLELLRELRSTTATRRLPVVVITAEGEERVHDAARQLDATLMTKPFSPSKLMASIEQILHKTMPSPPSSPPTPPTRPAA